jgi:RpiB/LacA/LacB family sugar-phosphate isomerase
MRIAIGCDHAGFALKGALAAALEADGHDLLDLGTFSSEPVDYPDFARSVGQAVLRGFAELGVLVCGSGVGASIAANKLRGIRAALCGETFTARQSREDDDANVLCLGARVLDEARAIEIARAWLAARFSADERHVRRLAKISQLEEGDQAAAPRARSAPPSRGMPAAATPPSVTPALATAPAASRPIPAPVPAAARGGAGGRGASEGSLAERAAELIRQFTETHGEEPTPAEEHVISLTDEDAGLEALAPASASPARKRRAAVTPSGPTAPPPRAAGPPIPDALGLPAVHQAVAGLEGADFVGRLWLKDTALWPGEAAEIRNRLGWLTAPRIMSDQVADIRAFADEVRRLQFTHVVLLGMGGSSLSTEVFIQTFGSKLGFPDLLMLDSTNPGAVRRVLDRINLARTLFVVSTKSGTTAETLAFYAFFRGQVDAARPSHPGHHFVAITDPGTPLEQLATEGGFRRAFLNPPSIGGRYSALSFFGLVPAALMGVDIGTLLDRAQVMVGACGADVPARDNPGLRLGAALAGLARQGRDKVTFVLSDRLRALGAWIEQLLAESLGKNGKGVVPVDGEPVGAPAVYGDDRLFVAITLAGDESHEAALAEIARAGHPVIRLSLHDPLDVGAEFFRWEIATATAGALLGVNPFDEPDVTSAKTKTGTLLAEWKRARRRPAWRADVEDDVLAVTGGGGSAASVSDAIAAHLALGRARDYLAIQAYLTPRPEIWTRLSELRVLLRDRLRIATTLAYGPRYLHSTGQLHKGGPDTGLFVQITGDDTEDLAVPGASHSFATLAAAQAEGDFEALREARRRVVRVHLKGRPLAALDRLLKVIRGLGAPA